MFGECHAHIMLDGLDYHAARNRHAGTICTAYIRSVFETYQALGITFVRDGGDNLGVSRAAKTLAAEYGIAYATPVFAVYKQGNYGAFVGRPYTDMAHFKRLADEAQREGATFMKLMVTGILDFDRYGTVSQGCIPDDELCEIIRIAHARGFAVMAHVNGARQIIKTVMAGADSIEHGFYQNEESFSAMKACGSVWVPTLSTVKNLLNTSRPVGEALTRIVKEHENKIRFAFESGNRIALGSDAGAYAVRHGYGAMDEYRALAHVIGDKNALDARLQEGEDIIKDKFLVRRGQGTWK